MDDSNYMKYNYHTSINQDNTGINVSKPNVRLRNKYSTR